MSELIREEWLRGAVSLLVRIVEAAAAFVIFAGAAVAFVLFLFASLNGQRLLSFERIRLLLGRFLALGLEFQLGADLLRTAVAPTWEQIGQLAAVAAIRTSLNYFLSKEIREEQRQAREQDTARAEEDRGARAPDLPPVRAPAERGDAETPSPPPH